MMQSAHNIWTIKQTCHGTVGWTTGTASVLWKIQTKQVPKCVLGEQLGMTDFPNKCGKRPLKWLCVHVCLIIEVHTGYLFLLNWMANPDIGCRARFVSVNSINSCPFLREKVPEISKPFPFAAGNQTWTTKYRQSIDWTQTPCHCHRDPTKNTRTFKTYTWQ